MAVTEPRQACLLATQEIPEIRSSVARARQSGLRIGCVPTMGALHAGHRSLMEAARRECGFVVVTIFVNPTQFGPNEDYTRYPRPLEDDLNICREVGVDLVFHPETPAMYPPGATTRVEVGGLSEVLEGAYRPGHFCGVTTVVSKLLNITAPDIAYFGAKDYQQQLLIRRMCADLDMPVEIRTCPTVREADGLALSSRNAYLSAEHRQQALALSQALFLARELLQSGRQDMAAVRREMESRLKAEPDLTLDYATIADPDTLEELTAPAPRMQALVAARVGTTRLIDNLPVELTSGT